MPSETESKGDRGVGVLVGALVAAMVLFAVVGISGLARLNDVVGEMKQQGEELAALRVEQAAASCLQQNDTIARLRASFADSVRTAIPSETTDPRIAPFLANYDRSVTARLRFRDCSPVGITAYFSNPPPPVDCHPDGKGFCQ